MKLSAPSGDTVRVVSLLYGRCGCVKAPGCRKSTDRFHQRMVGRYVGARASFRGQIESAVIDLRGLEWEQYLAGVKRVHKGNAYRSAQRADRAGFICKRFAWRNHIPDVVEINMSKDVRSGGEMKQAYRRTVEEMGGAPTRLRDVADPECPVHTTWCWGIFKPIEGYMQGEIITHEKLLGYIKLKRQGSLGIYSTILGHGEYLDEGVMYRLHYAVMQWISENRDGCLKRLDYLLYGAFDSGTAGLQMWKKRCLFQGAYLVLDADDADTHAES